MGTAEERVSYVEAKVEEHSLAIGGVRDLIVGLDQKMDRLITGLDQKIAAVDQKIDRRFEALETRFEAIDRRFEAVDRRFDAVERRFDAVDRRFNWVIGIEFGILTTIVAGLFGIIATLLRP